MVATREERAEKVARQVAPPFPRVQLLRTRDWGVPTRPRESTPTRVRHTSTTVNNYTVLTSAGGTDTFARANVGQSGAQILFTLPHGLTHDQAHEAAVRFMRRRGPDYLPATSMRITLDSRGRARNTEHV